MIRRMQGRTALVTGAGSGLGAAIAARLATDGAVVVVNDLDAAAAERTAKEIGGEVAVFDVSSSADVDAAVDGVVERHGRLDVLVNNAGIAPNRPELYERGMAIQMAKMAGEPVSPLGATVELSDEAFDRMIKVHLYGTFFCTRAALRHMEPARSGSIVNMASVLGLLGSGGGPDYAAAKGAIIALTKSTAAEVAPLGIRVNAVAPGFIDTPLLDFMDATMKSMIALRATSGRLGRAEEVAEAVRFLAGDEGSYAFGEILTLTGGFS
jgi:3-oxoacyl-[acyl-carrier protein] reductase